MKGIYGRLLYCNYPIHDNIIRFCENFIAIEMLDRLIRNGRDEDLVSFKLWVE